VKQLAFFTVFIVGFWAGLLPAQTIHLPATEIQHRHQLALERLPDSSWIVLKAPSATDAQRIRYIPEADILWFTGSGLPGCAFMLFKQGSWHAAPNVSSVFFTPDPEKIAQGLFDTVLFIGRFSHLFNSLNHHFTHLYTRLPEPEFVADWINSKAIFLHQNATKQYQTKYPEKKVLPIEKINTALREIKSPHETEIIRKAIQLTGLGIEAAMRICGPGVHEFELQAAIEHEMKAGGAITTAFPSIIGSGPNGLILHHEENDRTMTEGDLVVMDVGAWYNGYSADITRTLPVTGKFTDAQKNLYNLVLKAQKEAIEMVKPGVTITQLQKTIQHIFTQAGYPTQYMPHGVSHSLGIETHDVMGTDTLRAGMIITIEPGLYIPIHDTTQPAAIRGSGIRIEDDILVTETGSEVLSRDIPKKAEEIERFMLKERKNNTR